MDILYSYYHHKTIPIDWCFILTHLHLHVHVLHVLHLDTLSDLTLQSLHCLRCRRFELLRFDFLEKLLSSLEYRLYLFCVQAEIIQQGTMYLSLDVGRRAPLGLAWGLVPDNRTGTPLLQCQ